MALLTSALVILFALPTGLAIGRCREDHSCLHKDSHASVCHCWSTCSISDSGRKCDGADPAWDSVTKDNLATNSEGCSWIPGGDNTRELCLFEYEAKKNACLKFARGSTTQCSKDMWANVWEDMFSADQQHGNCTDLPLRFVYTLQDNSVHISGKTACGGSWGQLFQPGSAADPMITVSANPCQAHISLASMVPVKDPRYPFVQKGALEFTVTYGMLHDTESPTATPVLKWNGLYNGKGGSWLDDSGKEINVPASDCDNFWARLPASSVPTEIHV